MNIGVVYVRGALKEFFIVKSALLYLGRMLPLIFRITPDRMQSIALSFEKDVSIRNGSQSSKGNALFSKKCAPINTLIPCCLENVLSNVPINLLIGPYAQKDIIWIEELC